MDYLCRWIHRLGPTVVWLPPRLPWERNATLAAAHGASVAISCTLEDLRDFEREGAVNLSEMDGFVTLTLTDATREKYETRSKALVASHSGMGSGQ